VLPAARVPGAVVGVGVIGTGFGATVAVPSFAGVTGADVVAISGRRREAVEQTAARFGVPFATDDVGQLLARDDVDLVFVTTPPHLHRETVLAALDAGKHVLCEKPFGLTPSESLDMLRRAQDRELLHFMDLEFRTDRARRELARTIHAGDLGEVRQVAITAMVAGLRFPVMNREGWWQRRELGGGWLGAMGSHYIDALRVWCGEIRSVSARLETRRTHLPDAPDAPPITADDGFVARLVTESGVVCVVNTASSVGASAGPRVEVTGTEGAAVLEQDHVLTIVDAAGTKTRHDFTPEIDPRAHPSLAATSVWAAEVVEAVRTGTQIAPNFVDGLRVQEVIEAARRSDDQDGIEVTVDHHPVEED
jgi:predicted dehydrogenase